jgi:hypothetical protein
MRLWLKYLSRFIFLQLLICRFLGANEIRAYLDPSRDHLLHWRRANLSLGSSLGKNKKYGANDAANFFLNYGNYHSSLSNIREINKEQWNLLSGGEFPVVTSGRAREFLSIVSELGWQRNSIHFAGRQYSRDELDLSLGFFAALERWNFIFIQKGLGDSLGAGKGKMQPASMVVVTGWRLHHTLIHFTNHMIGRKDQGLGIFKSYQGLEFSYILSESLVIRTGFALSENGWMAGLVWSFSQIKLAYEFKTDSSRNTSHYVSLSWSLAGQQSRAMANSQDATIKFNSGKVNKYSARKKSGDILKKSYFQKGIRQAKKGKAVFRKKFHRKKRPFIQRSKVVLTIQGLIRKGMAPARALTIYRHWDAGLSLETIIRKMNLTAKEKMILLTFKG